MREKLLSYLNSVFDKDPYQVLVMRISHVSGACWKIEDRTLRLWTETNEYGYSFDLRQYTIMELANQISALEFNAVYLNPSFTSLPADILMEGEGVETSHNGDHLYTFSSTLWKILNPIGLILQETKENAIDEGLKMAHYHSATEFWMEKWSSYFGSPAQGGESDEDFLARTIAEVVRIRNTPNALKNAVKDLTGIDVFIHEVWRDYWSADNPGNADGRWCQFEAVVYHDITEDQQADINSIIERNRPVGVTFAGVVRTLQFMLQADINYDPYLYQRQEPVDWHIDHDWTEDEGGYFQWDDVSTYGFNISMAMS